MKIAVYGICKNEAKHLQDFHQNTIDADEVVVCDTGSTDGSQFMVNHQISVLPFRFDVARNAALALVPADVDVCISLDMDERLSPGWRKELERVWNDPRAEGATCMSVEYRTPGLAPFYHNSRIHARNGYYWADPCHECIKPWMIDPMTISTAALWIDHHPDKTKPRSYLPLLAAGIDEEPWNSRRQMYYARELMCHGHYKIALGWFRKYMEVWKASGAPVNWEVEQASAMMEVCAGALSEQQQPR